MVGIIDYGMGNLLSVFNAFDFLGADVKLCSKPEEIKSVERIVLPGVGAFDDCMSSLTNAGFVDALNETILKHGKPILGICLGMQAMAFNSEEGEKAIGLGWFDAHVVKIVPDNPSLHVPHVGWNSIEYETDCELFEGLPESPDLYFVHSYYMKCSHPSHVAASCDYGGKIAAAVKRDNIFATQFHPEKSQDYGLKILQNFLEWKP